jgi:hypothetical protein
MYKACSKNKRENPESYRDEHNDPELQAAAASQFAELLSEMSRNEISSEKSDQASA